jgi:hypothetical protein
MPTKRRSKPTANAAEAKRLHEISEVAVRLAPCSPEEAKKRLTVLALSLAENNFDWPAAAISAFLTGKCKTLDQAFGTKPVASRGRKRSACVDVRAREIFALKLTGRSWKSIADELGADERELRRIYGPRKNHLIADEITRRLDKKPPYRRPKPGV